MGESNEQGDGSSGAARHDRTGRDVAEHASAFPFQTTVDRLIEAISAAGMRIFSQVDHAAGARDVGLSLPPTLVLTYGHPKGGTPIMLAAPRSALDLPLRVLVREDDAGKTFVLFHPVADQLRGHGVPEALAVRLEPAQRILLEAIKS